MACTDYSEYWRALEGGNIVDFVLCPYQDQMTGPVFAVLVLGMINGAIYIRQDSALVPVVLTLALSGVFLNEIAAPMQGIMLAVVIMTIGLGPVVLLRRVDLG